MKKYSKGGMIAKMIVFGALAIGAFTAVLMFLWNWLMPAIFGLGLITFWQALGLLALSKIIFGGGRKPNWRHKYKSKMHREKFMKHFGEKPWKNYESQPDMTQS